MMKKHPKMKKYLKLALVLAIPLCLLIGFVIYIDVREAITYRRMGRDLTDVRGLRRLTQERKDDPGIRSSYLLALLLSGNEQEYSTEMEKAIRQFPDHYYIQMLYGRYLVDNGKYSEGIKYLKKIVDYSSGDYSTLEALGDALAEVGNIKEAIYWYERAKACMPDPKAIDAKIKRVRSRPL